MKCPVCLENELKSNRKFCSRKCSNIYNKQKLTGEEFACPICGQLTYVKPSKVNYYREENHFKYCSKEHQNLHYKQRFSGENNPAFGKTYRTKETHPEWVDAIQQGTKGKVNLGDKNGMKNPEVATRMSKTRCEKVTSDPNYRKYHSERMIQAWADGKYDHVKTGKCQWYEYTKSDGSIIKLQGTWEIAYARYLDSNNILYEAHKGRIKYVDENNVERSYYPDFYLIDSQTFIDIKGAFWDDVQRNKFVLIRKSNENIKLEILTGDKLFDLGINLKSIQKELLITEK